MRRLCVRIAAVGILLPALSAADTAAQPLPPPVGKVPSRRATPLPPASGSPDLDRLRSDAAKMARDAAETAKDAESIVRPSERVLLQLQVAELLKRLDEKMSAPRVGTIGGGPVTNPAAPSTGDFRPNQPIRAAENYFRSGDFNAAYQTLRLVDLSQFSRSDRAFAQYLAGCCLRRLNQPTQAAAEFRRVLDEHEDEFLTECARTQLGTIRATEELEALRAQLRSRPGGP